MPPPSSHPLSFPLFFVSLAHFTLVRRPSHASHFFASCQPTNQAAKSSSDVAPTDKWSALGLPGCLRALLVDAFFHLSRPFAFFPRLPPSLYLSSSLAPSTAFPSAPLYHHPPPPFGRRLYPVSRASPSSFTPVFTFYFTSRSFIIFLISPGYPFVRDNCRKWGGSRAADGKWFFRPPSDLNLRAIVAARDPFSTAVSIRRSSQTPSGHSTRVHESVSNATEISPIGLLRDKCRLSDLNVGRSDRVVIPGIYYARFKRCKMS